MIIPMKKISFITHHADYEVFLNELQQLGVLHIIEKQKDVSEGIKQKYGLIADINLAIKMLESRKPNGTKHDIEEKGLEVLSEIQNTETAIEEKQQQLAIVLKEIDEISPWGKFSIKKIEELQQAGIIIRFFAVANRKFKRKWRSNHNIQVVAIVKGMRYFVIVQQNVKEEIFLPDVEELVAPERTLAEAVEEKNALENEIERLKNKLDSYAKYAIPLLNSAKQQIETEAEYNKALETTERVAENRLMLLEGWFPEPKEADIHSFLEEKKVVYIVESANTDDKVPILLKNNKFTKLFEPIGNLFSMPNYKEMDLTPMFAPFFMLFFGFCLGDAGYGLLILLGATIFKPKLSEDVKPFLTLAQFLGGGTILFGILSGTLFGINLIESSIPLFSSVKHFFLDSEKMFNLALILGVIQILFGTAVRAVNQTRQNGFAYAVSPLGWILLILSLGDMNLTNFGGIVSTIALYISLAMIIWGSAPKGNIFAKLGAGIWDLYGITGIFGDVLSYIRLFALGVSSAILGFVINEIALQILDSNAILGPIFFVVFLLIGHSANIVISSLGSFVHPMRLTFVEFYKNAGFAGGGKAYKPFKNKQIVNK